MNVKSQEDQILGEKIIEIIEEMIGIQIDEKMIIEEMIEGMTGEMIGGTIEGMIEGEMIEGTIEMTIDEMIEEILEISHLLEINIHRLESLILGQIQFQEVLLQGIILKIPNIVDQGQEIIVIQNTILSMIHPEIPDMKKP